MTRLVVHSKVDPDGILRLIVPIGAVEADREMQVTIESRAPVNPVAGEYQGWLDTIAGRWQGELERMPEAPYESRDAL
jgi:hypothetical protein